MSMNTKKGQALVEFVLILPIVVLLILFIIDIGVIVYNQVTLENKMEQVYDLYSNDKIHKIDSILDKDITFNQVSNNETTEITLTKEIQIITPGLNLILKNPYKINIKRVIPNE